MISKQVRAELLEPTAESLARCGERIRQGKLVAFPTETVYGLGADATNEDAVKGIFAAKERPFTDPVIVHIADVEMVDKIIEGHEVKRFIKEVGAELWPGPLTMIGPINDSYIPRMVGSNTGSIGVRLPSSEVARALITAAGRPIAAPSANKFMHVSPTRGIHVFDDLKHEDVVILNGEMSDLGIESTVVKVDWQADTQTYRLTLLRTGTYDFDLVQSKIRKMEAYKDTEFVVMKKRVTNTEEDVACAPGQLLKHYSPYVQAFLISRLTSQDDMIDMIKMEADCDTLGVIDFNKINVELKAKVKYYVDLDEAGDFKAAMKRLYDELRIAEDPKLGLKNILLVNLQKVLTEEQLALNTLADKMFRSASGVEIYYDEEGSFFSKP